MKITRLRANQKARIEIIPMIDVMFFLLATFIISSLSMQHYQGIGVNLSQGQAQKVSSQESITITINKDNLIFVNNHQVKLTDVKEHVKKLLNNQEKTFLIACDQDAKQGTVTQVMLLIKELGGHHFSIITKP